MDELFTITSTTCIWGGYSFHGDFKEESTIENFLSALISDSCFRKYDVKLHNGRCDVSDAKSHLFVIPNSVTAKSIVFYGHVKHFCEASIFFVLWLLQWLIKLLS